MVLNDMHKIISSDHHQALQFKEKKGYDNLLQYVSVVAYISRIIAENLDVDVDLCETIANCLELGSAAHGEINKKVIARKLEHNKAQKSYILAQELGVSQTALDEIIRPTRIEGKIVHYVDDLISTLPKLSEETVDKIISDIIENSQNGELKISDETKQSLK